MAESTVVRGLISRATARACITAILTIGGAGFLSAAPAAADALCDQMRAQYGPNWPRIDVPTYTPPPQQNPAPQAPGNTGAPNGGPGIGGSPGPGPGSGNGTPIVGGPEPDTDSPGSVAGGAATTTPDPDVPGRLPSPAEVPGPDVQSEIPATLAPAETPLPPATDDAQETHNSYTGPTTVGQPTDSGIPLPIWLMAAAAAVAASAPRSLLSRGGATRGQIGPSRLVLIHDETSPNTYRFAMNVPDGGTTRINPDGSATVYDRDGNAVRHYARPWAYDSTGRPQTTWYTVDENGDLIQHVEPADNAIYPILADPMQHLDPADWTGAGAQESPAEIPDQSTMQAPLSTEQASKFAGGGDELHMSPPPPDSSTVSSTGELGEQITEFYNRDGELILRQERFEDPAHPEAGTTVRQIDYKNEKMAVLNYDENGKLYNSSYTDADVSVLLRPGGDLSATLIDPDADYDWEAIAQAIPQEFDSGEGDQRIILNKGQEQLTVNSDGSAVLTDFEQDRALYFRSGENEPYKMTHANGYSLGPGEAYVDTVDAAIDFGGSLIGRGPYGTLDTWNAIDEGITESLGAIILYLPKNMYDWGMTISSPEGEYQRPNREAELLGTLAGVNPEYFETSPDYAYGTVATLGIAAFVPFGAFTKLLRPRGMGGRLLRDVPTPERPELRTPTPAPKADPVPREPTGPRAELVDPDPGISAPPQNVTPRAVPNAPTPDPPLSPQTLTPKSYAPDADPESIRSQSLTGRIGRQTENIDQFIDAIDNPMEQILIPSQVTPPVDNFLIGLGASQLTLEGTIAAAAIGIMVIIRGIMIRLGR